MTIYAEVYVHEQHNDNVLGFDRCKRIKFKVSFLAVQKPGENKKENKRAALLLKFESSRDLSGGGGGRSELVLFTV